MGSRHTLQGFTLQYYADIPELFVRCRFHKLEPASRLAVNAQQQLTRGAIWELQREPKQSSVIDDQAGSLSTYLRGPAKMTEMTLVPSKRFA